MPQNPQNRMTQNAFKCYNKFRSVVTESLIWLQIITYTGKKPRFERTVKERDQ